MSTVEDYEDAVGISVTDVKAERWLIASVLWGNDVYSRSALVPTDFVLPEHARMWEAILALRDRRATVDQLSVAERDPITERGQVNVWQITDDPEFNSAFGDHYEQIVSERVQRRRIRELAPNLKLMADEVSGDELPEAVRHVMQGALATQATASRPSSETLRRSIAMLGTQEDLLPTPWSRLTTAIKGFRRGGLYVIGARPGVGKSAVALAIATRLSDVGRVSYSSLEMSEAENHHRLLAQQLQIPSDMLGAGVGSLPPALAARVDWYLNHQNLRIHFDDRPGVTISDIRRFAEATAGTERLAGIVVDYIQLIGSQGKSRDTKRYEILGDITRRLKVMAGEMDCPVIALSQLNRETAHRTNPRPQVTDLRESGSIEQDADVVMLLHRQMVDDVMSDELEVILAKNRQGQDAWLRLDWQGEFVRAWDPTMHTAFFNPSTGRPE